MEDFIPRTCPKIKDPSPLPEKPVVAMAYVPFQQWSETFDPMKGFDKGTIFPDLDKPFLYGRGELK